MPQEGLFDHREDKLRLCLNQQYYDRDFGRFIRAVGFHAPATPEASRTLGEHLLKHRFEPQGVRRAASSSGKAEMLVATPI